MLVKAVECGECKSIVYSRTDNDVRECTCGRIVVSGGLQHFSCAIHPGAAYEIKKVEVRATPNMLYDDWHSLTDQYGLCMPSVEIEEVQTNSIYIA